MKSSKTRPPCEGRTKKTVGRGTKNKKNRKIGGKDKHRWPREKMLVWQNKNNHNKRGNAATLVGKGKMALGEAEGIRGGKIGYAMTE